VNEDDSASEAEEASFDGTSDDEDNIRAEDKRQGGGGAEGNADGKKGAAGWDPSVAPSTTHFLSPFSPRLDSPPTLRARLRAHIHTSHTPALPATESPQTNAQRQALVQQLTGQMQEMAFKHQPLAISILACQAATARGVRPRTRLDHPTAVHLLGPSGTLKTMVAKLVANALGWDVVVVDGTNKNYTSAKGDFNKTMLNKFTDDVRSANSFERNGRAVLVFDEIDSYPAILQFVVKTVLDNEVPGLDLSRTLVVVCSNYGRGLLSAFATVVRKAGGQVVGVRAIELADALLKGEFNEVFVGDEREQLLENIPLRLRHGNCKAPSPYPSQPKGLPLDDKVIDRLPHLPSAPCFPVPLTALRAELRTTLEKATREWNDGHLPRAGVRVDFELVCEVQQLSVLWGVSEVTGLRQLDTAKKTITRLLNNVNDKRLQQAIEKAERSTRTVRRALNELGGEDAWRCAVPCSSSWHLRQEAKRRGSVELVDCDGELLARVEVVSGRCARHF
jgi:hypothetical protein